MVLKHEGTTRPFRKVPTTAKTYCIIYLEFSSETEPIGYKCAPGLMMGPHPHKHHKVKTP